MIVIPGRIPIIIHPFFWVFAFVIGWLYAQTFAGALIWVAILFVSVLIHEFGHALTAVGFKQKVQIQLVALGGVTSYEGPKLRFWQQFCITFNGPLFGFLLFLVASLLLRAHLEAFPKIQGVLKATQVANLFWTVVNLLPVQPLDGGQLLRIVLEAAFGVKGFKASLFIGAIIAILFALYFFMAQAFLVGAIFFLFAFQSFDSWRKSSRLVASDRDEDNRRLLLEGEAVLKSGDRQKARALFDNVCKKAQGGLLYFTACQYLALIDVQEGKSKEAYDLLAPIKKYLAEEPLCLLQKLAEQQKDYALVAELSSDCYQFAQNQEVALRNARAFAYLQQPKPSGGWLQTAWQHGALNLETLLSEEEFSAIKNDPDFHSFIAQLKNTP